jgi:hypothetical protein
VELWLVLVVLGAAISAVAGGIWLAERPRPDPASEPPPPPPPGTRDQPPRTEAEAELEPEPEPGLPTFRVVALGLEGAGKTVLLASQFHTLSGLDRNRRYFLDILDPAQESFLEWIFGQVSDTSKSWPPGSQVGQREFLFDCKAFEAHRESRDLFRLSLLDYAGEVFEPRGHQHEALREVVDKVKSAHALLVIIDGRRMLQLLRDEPDGQDYFERRMRPLLRAAARASCPVQLIVTKWDILRAARPGARDDEARLREVRDRLERCAGIDHLVHATGAAQGKIRLIPVSAVGEAFAELRPDGTTAKRNGATIAPINVEVPLCAVLPDLLKHLEHLLVAPAVREELEAELRRRPVADIPEIVKAVLASPAGQVLRGALASVVSDAGVKLLVDVLARVRSREEEPAAVQARDVDRADEEDLGQLRAATVEEMERMVQGLEFTLPSSVLRSRW